MFLRTTFNAFFKSRQKLLIKRRKIQLKNRPISNKRLKEEREHINVAYETKILNIRKEMDRTKSPNHHLNEIIQDLFYPEIKLNSQQQVDQRVRQVSSEALSREKEWQQLIKMDGLTAKLLQNALPLQLLEVHEQNNQHFQTKHYYTLMQKMCTYCFRKEKIKKKRLDHWQQMVKKMKVKEGKMKQIKCPYVFLEKDQIPRHQFWLNMVEAIKIKIQELTDISDVNEYIPILLLIQKAFAHIPAEIYLLVLNKNATVTFESLTAEHVSNLLNLLKFRNKIKFNPSIKIELTEQNQPKESSHVQLARKLAAALIQNPADYTAEDLSNIFKIINSRKRKMMIIQQNQFKKIQDIISPLLNELSFESVQTFFTIYCVFNQNPSLEFAEIVKYDLYRKADQCNNYFYLYDLITRIKDRKLEFKVFMSKGVDSKALKLQAADLLMRLSQTITKMIEKLRAQELIQLLNTYYENDVRDQSIIEILSTEIVKKAAEYDLETLGKSLFKLTLLNHRSKVLAKYIFKEFESRYHSEMKMYKEEDVFLLPTEDKVQAVMGMNFKQIHLQECLLMMLWSINRQLEENLPNEVNMNSLLELIPLKIESGDPLAMELALNINSALKNFDFFPKITYPVFNSESFPMGRLEQFYYKNFHQNSVNSLMCEEAKQSKLFIGNYNPKANMFLIERWSFQKVYSPEQYIEFCERRDSCNVEEKGNCFFDSDVILSKQFLQKRKKIMTELREKNVSRQDESKQQRIKRKNSKIYDLL